MPTYEYRCDSCGYDFEAVQGFSDEPLTVCPKCGSPVRKMFSSVGVVFKGSGFYSTDSHQTSHGSTQTSKAAPPPKPTTEPAAEPSTA